jgi:hypothetical protein
VSTNNYHSNLEGLRRRLQQKPRTRAAQVRQAWPYIRELLDAGHTIKDIWTWLGEAGIEVCYARLCEYVRVLRRQQQSVATPKPLAPGAPNLPDRERPRPGFHYNPDPDQKKLI